MLPLSYGWQFRIIPGLQASFSGLEHTSENVPCTTLPAGMWIPFGIVLSYKHHVLG